MHVHPFATALLPVALLVLAGCGDAPAPGSASDTTAEAGPASDAPATPPGAPPDTLRVLAYNIHHAAGNDGVLDLERIARVIRNLEPDLVALQEVDRGVERTGGVDQTAVLAELTGMSPVFGEFMPYQGGEYGMAVLSAWPIVESWNHRLPDGAEPRTSVTVRVRSPDTGREIVLADIHFYRTEAERLAQATTLDSLLRATAATIVAGDPPRADDPSLADDPSVGGPPAILAGDFNSESGTAVMDTLASLGWWTVPKDGPSLTFRSDAPVREIDFLLLRPRERFEVIEHHVVDEPVASDHAPIFAELVVR